MSKTFKVTLASMFIAAFALTVSTVSAAAPATNFASNMKLGSTGQAVKELQMFLNACADTTVNPTVGGAGSSGYETMYFGPATKAAVMKYQTKMGVTPVSGNFYPLTRGQASTMGNPCGGVIITPPPVSGPVSVSAANTTPSNYIVAGQAGAKLASFTFSGTGSVSKLVLMRTGVSTNDTLRNVYLYDGANRITDAASVTSDGKITFNNPSGLFMAPKTIDVRADILCSNGVGTCTSGVITSGQTVGVSVSEMMVVGGTSSAMVSGVMGNLMSISSAATATISLTNNQANSNLNVNAGTVNQNIWDVTANIGTRAVWLKGLTFKYVGSASMDAVANLSLYIDGVKVGNTAMVNSMGLLTFDLSSSPVTLNTGNRTIQLRGDFMKGSGRSAQFYIQNSADFMLEDSQLAGAFITPTIAGNAATNVYGYNFQIQNGSLVVSQDPAYTATQVVGGATNAILGKFQFKAYGEDVKVETLVLTPSGTFTGYVSGAKIQNVTLYVNGAAVGSSQNWTSGTLTFNPGSNMIIPAGGSAILEVRGDLRDGAGNNYTAGNVQVDVTSAGSTGRGQSSQNSVTINNQAGKNLTIGSANITFSKTGGFFGTTINPNTSNVKIGSFTLANSNFEDVRATNVLVSMTFGGGMLASHLSNVKVTDSATIIAQPTGSDNFSMDIIVPMNGSKVFDVWADIGSAPNGATVTTNATASYRGVNSANPTTTVATGITMTVNTATLVSGDVTKLSSSMPTQLVTGTSTVPGVVTYNVKSLTAPITVTEMTFTTAPSVDHITAIKVGGVTKQVVAGSNTVTGLNLIVPAGSSGLDIPVELTFGTVNTNGGLASQTTAATLATLTSIKYTSGNTSTTLTGLTLASNGMQLVASKPTVTIMQSAPTTGLNAGAENKIGEVTVTADAKGNIRINDIVFTTSFSGITAGTLTAARIASGSTTIPTSACAITGATPTFTVTCEFGTTSNTDNDGYTINASGSQTFSLFANVGGTLGSSGTSSVSSSVAGNATTFSWDDVVGGGTNLNATNHYNFPTNSYTVKN